MGKRKIEKYEHKTGVLFIRNLRTHIKDQFKAYCARRGKSMTEMIENFMLKALEDEIKLVDKATIGDAAMTKKRKIREEKQTKTHGRPLATEGL